MSAISAKLVQEFPDLGLDEGRQKSCGVLVSGRDFLRGDRYC